MGWVGGPEIEVSWGGGGGTVGMCGHRVSSVLCGPWIGPFRCLFWQMGGVVA